MTSVRDTRCSGVACPISTWPPPMDRCRYPRCPRSAFKPRHASGCRHLTMGASGKSRRRRVRRALGTPRSGPCSRPRSRLGSTRRIRRLGGRWHRCRPARGAYSAARPRGPWGSTDGGRFSFSRAAYDRTRPCGEWCGHLAGTLTASTDGYCRQPYRTTQLITMQFAQQDQSRTLASSIRI